MKNLVLVIAVAAAACGSGVGGTGGGAGGGSGGGAGGGQGPKAGDSCTGEIFCSSDEWGLFCEGDAGFSGGPTFQGYRCPGSEGCLSNSSIAKCDLRGSDVGSACPIRERNRAICSHGGALLCEATGWSLRPCLNCREQGGQLLCD